MKLADIANLIKIDSRKLTHYALDEQSPVGRHKAVQFKKRLGFNKENYLDLVLQIKQRVLEIEITFHSEDEFGKRYTAEIEIKGTAGQTEIVKTGWLIGHDSKAAHLTTLYQKIGGEMLQIGDLIELITDIPDKNLHTGMLGAIVHCHNENCYEIEFSNENGETLACLALESKQFILVWRSETKQWLSAAERVVNLIPNLPEDTAEEILHYACFLSLKKQLPYMTKTTAKFVAL